MKFLIVLQIMALPFSGLIAQTKSPDLKRELTKHYDLTRAHSKLIQYYQMESRVQIHALDGSIIGTDVYKLSLRASPSTDGVLGDEYTCLAFSILRNDSIEITIPSLIGWKHYYPEPEKKDGDKSLVFGIEHAKFENLKDGNGKAIPIENSYHVYNAFIDFHAMNLFSEKTKEGKGIQDLKKIGDKIVHMTAHSKPRVDLGKEVAEGSYFQNGEITLEFLGLTLVNEKPCAIIGYDSGKSSFYMMMKPMPGMEVPTTGSSHYWGEINKDIAGGWIQSAKLHELVISETTVPSLKNKVNRVIERTISIRNVKRP